VARSPGWRRHLPAALYLLALAGLLLALARPQATVLVPKQQANVILIMDVSGSMNATDVAPRACSPPSMPPAGSSTGSPAPTGSG
jgi:Ca-activated chloride channel family protein